MNTGNAISRRNFVTTGAISTLASTQAATASAANCIARLKPGRVGSEILTFDDPVEEFRQHLRIERSLVDEQGSTLTWYHWIAFVVAERRVPFPLLRF